MALTLELSIAVATTRTSQVLTDGTTYGTGGNPARSAVGVFCQAYKVDYDGTATALTTTGDDGDPETDTDWTIEYTDDGYYLYNFVVIPDFNSSSTYSQYDAVFNASDNKVYRSKQDNNTQDTLTNTTWWEEITGTGIAGLAANKDTSTESENITSVQYRRVLAKNGEYEYGNQLSNQNPREVDDSKDALRKYNLFAKMLDEVAIADSRSEVLAGELICRRIQSRFID